MKMLFKSKQKITNIARMVANKVEIEVTMKEQREKNIRTVNEIIKILVMNMSPYLTVFHTHENIYEVFTILSGSAVEM